MKLQSVLLLVGCALAAVVEATPQDDTKSAAAAHSDGLPADDAEVSASGWRPLLGDSPPRPPRTARTPQYAAPPLAADYRPSVLKDLQRDVVKDAQRDAAVRDAKLDVQATLRTVRHQAPPRDVARDVAKNFAGVAARDDPRLPPGGPWGQWGPWGPWGPGGLDAVPVTEPENEVDALLGYRYPLPAPSATAPFWEAALLRRRERLLQELGYRDCRCCSSSSSSSSDLPYRLGALGVGAYGLYGWSRPLHHHNTAPLGAARLHDNPN